MPTVLGKRIKALREERGLTQEELAASLQISRGALSMYEAGHRNPDYETVSSIARFFGTTVDYLVGHTDDPTPPHHSDFDPTADDWYDHAPEWLTEMYDDPEYRPYIEREDVRKILLDPSTWVMYRAKNQPKKAVRLDVLKFIAWRLDQEKEQE